MQLFYLMLFLFFYFFPSLCIFSSSLFSSGPEPVHSPTVSGLHPRSVTVTWLPPSQPNGIITNYTLYLKPSSVSSSNSSLGPKLSLFPSTEGVFPNLDHNLIPTSIGATPASGLISMSTFNRMTNDSSTTPDAKLNVVNPISSVRPGFTEDKHIDSSHISNTSQGHGSISFHPTEPSTSSVSPGSSPYNPGYSGTSSNTEHFIKHDRLHSPLSSSFSDASDSSSVTVPGNTTSYTFLDLLPYHAYSLQVLHIILCIKWKCHGSML